MVKAGDVIGRRITARDGGREMGKVKDLVVDSTGDQVIGIVLSDGLLTGSRVAPWAAVQAFGPDSVVIDAPTSVVKAKRAPEIKAVLDKKTQIRGLRLLTTLGRELGEISDMVFDESTGSVVGYELSSGLFSDTMEGNPFLPAPKWIELGKDTAFVAPEAEATVRSITGGIKGVFTRSPEKAGEGAREAESPAADGAGPAAEPGIGQDARPLPPV